MAIADEIIAKVEQKFLDTISLRERMDKDYDLWRLKKFTHPKMSGEGYETYTSNEPRTFARKCIAILNGAAIAIKCPQEKDPRQRRDQDNAKEQFARGNLKANDERLVRAGLLPLRRAMAYHLVVRGITTGRCTLVRYKDRSWADATHWDPRETAWEYDSQGLEWICRRYSMLRSAVQREFDLPPSDKAREQVVTIYDWYDSQSNIVVIPDVQAEPVKNMPHGMVDGYGDPRVPGWCVGNPVETQVQSTGLSGGRSLSVSQMGDLLSAYGESIFADNREVWDTHNFNMSIMKNLAGRSLKPVFGIESRSGVKLVEGDPFRAGAEIPLAIGEKLVVYDFLKSAPDLMPYMAVGQSEMQRGSFPAITHGELPGVISGFMGTVLKAGAGDKVEPMAEAMSLAMKDITNMWCDQFTTGAFPSFQLSGQGGNRKWFVATITPDMIRDLPELEVKLTPQLPEDNASKIQQALALRTPGVTGMALLSDYDIREGPLEREDSDQDLDTLMQEQASIHPLVQAARMADALAKRGDEGAQIWNAQYMMLLLQAMKSGFMPPELLNGPGLPGRHQNGNFSPETVPNAVQGIPSPTPGQNTPFQGGPMVPPGTPRPGAQGRNGGGLRRGVPPLP